MEENFDENQENPQLAAANFQTLSAEGDLLLQRGSFHEAIEVYSKALQFRPTDKHCLVCRSRCYIQIGAPRLALADADVSLKQDLNYFKGIFQKAEALYAQGDFELALMYYHRGHRLRPELSEFRIGIQKAREAIDNSIGNPKVMKIKVPQKLRRNLALMNTTFTTTASGEGSAPGQAVKPQAADTRPFYMSGNLTPSMESKLLGELYDDKTYLHELLKDRDFIDYPDEQVVSLVQEGLRYLNTRVEFWRQQNPLYARHKESKIKPKAAAHHPAHHDAPVKTK